MQPPLRTIRRATADDLDAVEAVALGDEAGSWSRESFAHELRLEWSRTDLLLDASGPDAAPEAVGFIVYWVVADELQLLYVATHPRHRRRGVGRALMEHLHARARELRVERILLEVRETNVAARRLYETQGYVTVGRRRGYYASNGEDAVLMERAREPREEVQ